MAITKAIEFDQTPNKLLFEIGEQARQQAMLKQKLELENREKQFQVLNEIDPASLYPKFEKEVVDQSIGGLLNQASEFLRNNPNASATEFRMFVNKPLGEMAQWSAKTKVVKENIKNALQNMDKDAPYDKGRLMAIANDRALYNTDQFGRKTLKPAEEIDVDFDVVSEVISNEPDKVIDPFKGQDMATKLISDASLFTKNVENTVETPDGKKTVVTGQKSSVPFYLEPSEGTLRVKQQNDGYIDEGVFQRFYQNPAMKVWIDANAKTIMGKAGVPESPEASEWFKRSFLTSWLDQNKKGVIDMVDKTLYAKPSTGITLNLGGSPNLKDGAIPAYDMLRDVVSKGEDPMTSNKIDNNTRTSILKIADESFSRSRRYKKPNKPSDIGVKIDKDGAMVIFNKTTNESVAISPQSFGMEANEKAGSRFVGNAAAGGTGFTFEWK